MCNCLPSVGNLSSRSAAPPLQRSVPCNCWWVEGVRTACRRVSASSVCSLSGMHHRCSAIPRRTYATHHRLTHALTEGARDRSDGCLITTTSSIPFPSPFPFPFCKATTPKQSKSSISGFSENLPSQSRSSQSQLLSCLLPSHTCQTVRRRSRLIASQPRYVPLCAGIARRIHPQVSPMTQPPTPWTGSRVHDAQLPFHLFFIFFFFILGASISLPSKIYHELTSPSSSRRLRSARITPTGKHGYNGSCCS